MVNLIPVPKVTGMAELVFAVMAELVTSELVSVALSAFLRVTLKVRVPLLSGALAGNVALLSLEAMATVSLVTIKFHEASTALTVTLKVAQALCAVGAPVLPVLVPGAAVSPGASNCKPANAPAFTVTFALVLLVSVPAASPAVSVRVPAVLNVRLDNVAVPATRVIFPAVPPLSSAIAALASELVIVTSGVALLTTFQLASTALTTMPLAMAVPAVCVLDVPILPVVVPGAALSPGSNTCRFVTGPGMTVRLELTTPGLDPSVAVSVVASALVRIVVNE